jgi:RNA polymerase sigma-70 factor (ECF subfamily)
VLNKLVGAEIALELDAQLMLRVRAGDTASFDQLLAKYRCPVIGDLARMVRNQAVAEELAQKVFLRVYKARASYEPTAKFTTWLYRIATRVTLNSIRDAKPQSGDRSLQESVQGKQPIQPADSLPNREQELVADA